MINSMLSLLVLGFLFVNYKNRINGIDYWIYSQMLSIAGFMVSVLRVVLPEPLAILGSNMLHFSAFMFLWEGLSRYLGTVFDHRLSIGLISGGVVGLFFFTLNQPNLQARTLILHGILFILSVRMMLSFNRSSLKVTQRASLIMRLTLMFYAVVSFYNMGTVLFAPAPDNYLEGNLFTIIGHIALIILTVMLTYAEVLLVSDKLLHKVITSEEKLNLVFDRSPVPILVSRLADGRIYNANESFVKSFGYTLKEVLGKTTLELHFWVDVSDRQKLVSTVLSNHRVDDYEAVFRFRNGDQRICRVNAIVINLMDDESNQPESYLLSSIYDITEDVHLRDDLKHLATHDHLTGLANRTLFYDRFDSDKARANRHQHQLAVIALDLDHLKQVNDKFGHPAGDAALVHLAKQISGVLRKSDTFARFGGDEFCILLDEIESHQDVETVIAKILDRVSTPFIFQGSPITVSISMGIALYPHDAETADDLIQRADMALYTVMRDRQTPFAYFKRPNA
jgi:diguanylate cyclase (GGDEF)-like protein/PAS domain S-box-containing protein